MSQPPFSSPYSSPYQSPQYTPSASPGASAKPTAVTVFGILHLVFGVFGVCGGVVGVASTAITMNAPPDAHAPNPVLEILQNSEAAVTWQYVSAIAACVVGGLLCLAGGGLLAGAGWGRALSIVYGFFAIVWGLVGQALNYILLIQPMIDRLNDVPEGPERAGMIGGIVGGAFGGVCGGLIGLAYPVLVLIFMYRANVVAYFQRDAGR